VRCSRARTAPLLDHRRAPAARPAPALAPGRAARAPPARARRGYINFYAVYIGWLCSAVFLHLPSFQALGIDVRTDLSMLLTIFLLSLLARDPGRQR